MLKKKEKNHIFDILGFIFSIKLKTQLKYKKKKKRFVQCMENVL